MRNAIQKICMKGLPAVLVSALCFNASATAADAEFLYNGDNGPGFWSELDPAWAACAGAGGRARQSPVNIDHVRPDRSLHALALQTFPTNVNLFNNGHTIEQHYEESGSSIDFEGKTYELLQFHFHSLSEHTVDGKHGALELHAVFQQTESDNKLVIGQIFDIGKKPNRFVQTLIDAGLPRKNGDTTVTPANINLTDALTSTASYYTYSGSLTTPPCTENVTWIVLAQTSYLSQAQFKSFSGVLGDDFRPLQELHGRVVRSTGVSTPHGEDHDHD